MESKICPACQEEINSKAARCPHCSSYQKSWVRTTRHPIFLIVLFLGLMSLSYLPMYGMMPEYTQSTIDIVKVLDSDFKISPSSCDNRNRVDVIGKLQNLTDKPLKRLTFSLEFFDADGKTVDFVTDEVHDLIIASKSESTFKAGGNITADPSVFHSHKVNVIQVQIGGTF